MKLQRESTDRYIRYFEEFERRLNGEQDSDIHQMRKEALQSFKQLGFPTRKQEEWKYTPVVNLIRKDLKPYNPKREGLEIDTYNRFDFLKAHRLVFLDGVYQPDLSELLEEDGLEILPLREARLEHEELFDRYYNRAANIEEEPFTALNTAFAEEGMFIHVAKKKRVEHPVLLIHLSSDRASSLFQQTRNLIIVEDQAEINLVEHYENTGSETSYCNAMTEQYVGKNARSNWVSIQDEPNIFYIGTKEVEQDRDSYFSHNAISTRGSLVRNNIHVKYIGEHCDCNIDGMYFTRSSDLIDNHLLVDHAVPRCESNQLYKGILDDRSTGVFNGKIIVRQDAQETNAYQSNKNVLLSKRATINTKPQLEIFADDVKCSHGATSGQLDELSKFYMKTRGIPEQLAKSLLTYAHLSEVIHRVKIPELREYLDRKLKEELDITF